MSSTIPQLTMFPLYPGGPQVRYNNNINADSSFYFPATKFTPQYGVNVPPKNSNIDTASFSLNGRKVEGAQNTSLFNQPIGFDGSVLGGIRKVPVSSVPPVVPNMYEKAEQLLSISDLKMSDLLAQPSFTMSNLGQGTGLGFKVTTDGSGGIDKVSLSLTSRGLTPNISALDPSLGGLKRAEITTGATFKTEMDSGLAGVKKSNPGKQSLNNQANKNLAANQLLALNTIGPNQGIQQANPLQQTGLNNLALGNDSDTNPVLQRLNQLQPVQDTGLPVSGFDSAVNVEESRQIATNQAKLDVVPSPQFKQDVASLVNAASRQSNDNYAAAFKTVNMDGRIPMSPSLPNAPHAASHHGAGMGQPDGFNLNSGLADASDKKGSGGYIPFQMQSNAQSQGGFSGSSNPFSGNGYANSQSQQQQQQQQQQQRRRLQAFVA